MNNGMNFEATSRRDPLVAALEVITGLFPTQSRDAGDCWLVVEGINGQLHLSSTNHDTSVRIVVPHAQAQDGRAVFDGHEFLDYVNRFLGEPRNPLALHTFPVRAYTMLWTGPVAPPPASAAVVDGDHFRAAVTPIVGAKAPDNALLNGFFGATLWFERDAIVFVGSNVHQMTVMRIPATVERHAIARRALLQTTDLKAALPGLIDRRVKLGLSDGHGRAPQLSLTSGDTSVTLRTVDARVDRWTDRLLIDAASLSTATVSRPDAGRALLHAERAAHWDTKTERPVIVALDATPIQITPGRSASAELGRTLIVDAELLRDALRNFVDVNEVAVHLSPAHPRDPVVITEATTTLGDVTKLHHMIAQYPSLPTP